MNKTIFLGGLVIGSVVTKYWRVLAKEGIKAGIVASGRFEELAQVAREELEDVTAEATSELEHKPVRVRT